MFELIITVPIIYKSYVKFGTTYINNKMHLTENNVK